MKLEHLDIDVPVETGSQTEMDIWDDAMKPFKIARIDTGEVVLTAKMVKMKTFSIVRGSSKLFQLHCKGVNVNMAWLCETIRYRPSKRTAEYIGETDEA